MRGMKANVAIPLMAGLVGAASIGGVGGMVLAGPASPAAPAPAAPRPAAISHVVLITLKDPTRVDDLIEASDRLLPSIPGVAAYACGRPGDFGRGIEADYHVGLYVGFQDADAYATYVSHAQHTELVGTWRAHIESMRVFDFQDPTP